MKFKIHCVSCLSHFKHWIATCGWDSTLDGANIGHSHHQRTFYWTALPARLVLIHSILSPVVTCDVCWKVMSIRPDPTAPLSCVSAVHLSVYFMVCSLFSSKEEVGRIWKLELLKESDGLGIQVSGGRGSKRSPHAIVVTQVKEGGAAHRWLVNSLPFSFISSPFPAPGPWDFHLVNALAITVHKGYAGAQRDIRPEWFYLNLSLSIGSG